MTHILPSQRIKTLFEELCSKAHDLEAQILRKKGKKEEGWNVCVDCNGGDKESQFHEDLEAKSPLRAFLYY